MSSKAIVQYTKGAMISMAHTPNPGFVHILKSGEINIESIFKFASKNLNRYLPGDTFGYVSAITGNPHSSTLIAATDCIVIRLSLESFFEYLKNNQEVFLKIISYNADKLRAFIDHIHPDKKDKTDNQDYPEKLIQNARIYITHEQNKLACFSLKKYLEGIFEKEKDPDKVVEAQDMLKKENPKYSLPNYPYYTDDSTFVLQKGDIIFVEDEAEDDYFYIVLQGSVKISKLVDGHEFILGILGKGEIFGEMAILNQRSRNATAIAFEDCVIQRLTANTILEKVDETILVKIFHVVSRRLWYAFHRVYMLKVSDPNVKLYIQLQMLIADEMAKADADKTKDKFIFRFSLQELLRMVDIMDINSDRINEFLSDQNFSFSNGLIVVKDRFVLDDKVDIVKKRHSRLLKEIII
ncbi:MAG TPA: cyclic nucleotide-binding domain-containing protein [Leptospiraceae bacterium]|nr:cyclic nucleotide-binding domain-containing protein [Leptospiraceae bacterium]